MNKAERAQSYLNDEFFMGEVNEIKRVCIEQITNSNDNDVNQREEAYRLYKAIDSIVNHFHSIAAQKQIDKSRWKIL